MPEVAHHEVGLATTLAFAALLVLMILTLAFEEKIHAKKSLITGVFAVLALFMGATFHLLPFGPLENVFHEFVREPVYIPAVDWSVIAIMNEDQQVR